MLAPLPTRRKQLLDAADLIEQRGFAQFTRCDERGALCVHGAISVAQTGNHRSGGQCDETTALLAAYLLANGAHEPGTGIPHWVTRDGGCAYWNNHPKRTKEEVVAALRGAALHGL